MNPFSLLSPYRWILLAALVAIVVIGVPIMVHRHDQAQQDIGAAKVAEEVRLVTQEQTARNRELQRAAETRYVVVQAKQDHFFTRATQEIHDAAAPLAACPVPEPVRVRLNAAAACARGDSPAACGDDDAVPGAR